MSACGHYAASVGEDSLFLVDIADLFAMTGFFQRPLERPPSRTMSYQLAANNLQARPTISGETI